MEQVDNFQAVPGLLSVCAMRRGGNEGLCGALPLVQEGPGIGRRVLGRAGSLGPTLGDRLARFFLLDDDPGKAKAADFLFVHVVYTLQNMCRTRARPLLEAEALDLAKHLLWQSSEGHPGCRRAARDILGMPQTPAAAPRAGRLKRRAHNLRTGSVPEGESRAAAPSAGAGRPRFRRGGHLMTGWT